MMIEPNDCKEERYCEEEVEGCLNKHYLLQCCQLFDHRNDEYGNTGPWLLLLVIFWNCGFWIFLLLFLLLNFYSETKSYPVYLQSQAVSLLTHQSNVWFQPFPLEIVLLPLLFCEGIYGCPEPNQYFKDSLKHSLIKLSEQLLCVYWRRSYQAFLD